MGTKQTFAGTRWDENANNGVGEWKAVFVNGDNNLAKAFGSAAGKPGLKTMGGFATLNHQQIDQRIDQLRAKGGHDDTISQLERGRGAIEAKASAPKVQVTGGMRM